MLRRRLAARLQPPLLELGQIDPDGLQVAPLGVNSRGAVHPQLLRLLAKLGVGLARNIVNGPGRVLWMTRQCRRARIRHSAPQPGAKLHEQPTRTIAAATPSRRSVRDGRPEIRKKPFLTPSTMPNKSKRSLGGCYTNMTDDLKNTSTMEAAAEDWARVNLPPRLTGLPMAVWITENDGYPRDVRVNVSTLHGGLGSWRAAPSIDVRPRPHEIVPGSLPAADVALVSHWIDPTRT